MHLPKLSFRESDHAVFVFSRLVQMYRKGYCSTLGLGVGGGVDVDKMLKFYVKVFM